MPTVLDVLHILDRLAPRQMAFEFDKVGLQIGDPNASIERAVVSLDASQAAISFAVESDAQLLLAHHPVIWEPLVEIRADDYNGRRVQALVKADIAFIAAHTNWDCAIGGVNDILTHGLGLSSVSALGSSVPEKRLKLVVFVPAGALETLIDVLSHAGAGEIGLYRRCAFTSEGVGTFIPMKGSDPHFGTVGNLEEIPEMKLEMVLPEARRAAVVSAIREHHPYEQPAFDLYPQIDGPGQPIARIGNLERAMILRAFVGHVNNCLATVSMAWGDPEATIERVAVCGGSADDEWRSAQEAGADVLVCGEVRHHVALEAAESGFCIIAAGHYATEQPGAIALMMALQAALPEIEWLMFEPTSGASGMPL